MRPSGEEVVAAAVVEVQVRVDDDVDAGEVEGLLAQWDEAGVKVGHLRVQLRHAGVERAGATPGCPRQESNLRTRFRKPRLLAERVQTVESRAVRPGGAADAGR